jgi:hypothetical protein
LVERWDDVPSVSENLKAARQAIGHHLDPLIEECRAWRLDDAGDRLVRRAPRET